MTLVPCDLKWNWNGVVRCDVSCTFWILDVLTFAKMIFLWPTIYLTHRPRCNDPFTLNEDSWDTLSFYNILTYNKPRVEVRTCYYVFRKSSIWRCCKSRHVTKQDVLLQVEVRATMYSENQAFKKSQVEVRATMYSENQAFGGAANRNMSLNKTCFN